MSKRAVYLIVLLAGGLILAGCKSPISSTPSGTTGGDRSVPGAVFTYPFDGEQDVPTGTVLIAKFSGPVDQSTIDASDCTRSAFQVIDQATGKCLNGKLTVAGDGSILRFSSSAIQPNRTYQMVADSRLMPVQNSLSSGSPIATFVTRHRGLYQGEKVSVAQVLPAADRFMDFSTLHVRFSQPVKPSTVQAGNSFRFTDAKGNEVDGRLIVKGRYLTFDPSQDLTPGEQYTLTLGSGIQTVNGDALTPYSETLTPQNTAPRTTQTLAITPSPANDSPGTTLPDSSLTGTEINSLALSSPLIGNVTSLADGALQTVMANPGNFQGLIPVSIPRGQLLKATGLDIKLGGQVPANLSSGDIHIKFLSDANGYLIRRPFEKDNGVPFNVRMTFDVAVTTGDPKANAILNQTVLQVQAAGTAVPNGKKLDIEAVGAMQLNLLNAGYATANFDFNLSIPSDQVIQPDQTPPKIVATYPDPNASNDPDAGSAFQAGDSLQVIFSEPVTPASVGQAVSLADNTSGATFSAGAGTLQVAMDGATAVLTPGSTASNGVFTPAPLTAGDSYTLQVSSGVQDNAGNPSASGTSVSFTVPAVPTNTGHDKPPLISGVYPGTPCALTGGDWNTSGGGDNAGRCAGGKASDDIFQVFTLPANRYLDIYFTKPMDPSSLTLATQDTGCPAPQDGSPNGSVVVERVDSSGNCQGIVPGTLEKSPRNVRFVPNDPWQAGQRYAFELRTGPEGSATCASNEVCGFQGMPLNPDPLNGAASGGSNTPFVIPFDAVAAVHDSSYVPVTLRPFTDQNGNGYVDAGETRYTETNSSGQQITENSANAEIASCADVSTLLGVGICPINLSGDPHIYLNRPLPVILGTADGNGRIPVTIMPGVLYGTNLTMTASAFNLPATTGMTIMRIRQVRIPINPDGSTGSAEPGKDPLGYITYKTDPATGDKVPWMNVYMDIYMDSPDESVPLGGSTDLHSKKVGPIDLAGPVQFGDDGRLVITLSNQQPIDIPVTASASGGSSTVTIVIAAGQMQLHYLGAPLRGETASLPQGG